MKFIFILFIFFIKIINSEIIDNKKITTKKFDNWIVSCENDEMFNKIKCQMFVEITDGTTIFVNPNSKENKLLFISKDIYPDTNIYIKIDDNKLYESEITTQNKYNFIKFKQEYLNEMYTQIRTGKILFVRITIRDKLDSNGFKEITVKIPLAEFQKAFVFLLEQRNKYDKK